MSWVWPKLDRNVRERNASRAVLFYRWFVFLLAAGYCLRTILLSSYEQTGGPFRFLTIWALFGSFFVASRLLALTEGRSKKRWDGVVSMVAVLNAMVVFLFWRLYFADPFSVTTDGTLNESYLEIYLHALGPLLQWIDAVFIHRSFRRLWRAALGLIVLISVYVAWAELFVQRFNNTPRGTVTSGLPYPFLNSLELPDRAVFYGTNFAAALVLLLVFGAITWTVRRWVPAPITP